MATFEELYMEMSGTSMAAPHVSGIIAAFLSQTEGVHRLSRIDVKAMLLGSCIGSRARQRSMQGAGMPNLIKMLAFN